jgi:hypothetical protein
VPPRDSKQWWPTEYILHSRFAVRMQRVGILKTIAI